MFVERYAVDMNRLKFIDSSRCISRALDNCTISRMFPSGYILRTLVRALSGELSHKG